MSDHGMIENVSSRNVNTNRARMIFCRPFRDSIFSSVDCVMTASSSSVKTLTMSAGDRLRLRYERQRVAHTAVLTLTADDAR